MEAIKTLEMDKAAWLELRKRGIGASEVAAVLGLNPYKTPLQVYEEKIADQVVEYPETLRMKRGLQMENLVADIYMEEYHRTVRRDNKMRIHPAHDFLYCSLDRTIVAENGSGPGILEIKTASGWAVKKWEAVIPTQYFCQIQHQFAVTGYKWGEFAVFVDGCDLMSFQVSPDQEFIEIQTAALVKWWNEHVVARVPPPFTVPDLDIASSDPHAIIQATPEIANLVKRLEQAQDEAKDLDADIEAYKNQVKLFMDTKEVLAIDGRCLATYKTSKPSFTVDGKILKAIDPTLYEKCLKPRKVSRPFRLASTDEEGE